MTRVPRALLQLLDLGDQRADVDVRRCATMSSLRATSRAAWPRAAAASTAWSTCARHVGRRLLDRALERALAREDLLDGRARVGILDRSWIGQRRRHSTSLRLLLGAECVERDHREIGEAAENADRQRAEPDRERRGAGGDAEVDRIDRRLREQLRGRASTAPSVSRRRVPSEECRQVAVDLDDGVGQSPSRSCLARPLRSLQHGRVGGLAVRDREDLHRRVLG